MTIINKCTRLLRVRRCLFRCSSSSTRKDEILKDFNADIKKGNIVPIYKLAALYDDKTAIKDEYGSYTYKKIFNSAKLFSYKIREMLGGRNQQTITYLCPINCSHVVTQWAIWMSGNIAVPLSSQYPPSSLQYFMEDSGSSATICEKSYIDKLPDYNKKSVISFSYKELFVNSELFVNLEEDDVSFEDLPDNKFYSYVDAMILYTSGTTSKPKGVVYGFNQIASQVLSLHTAWDYNFNDVLLHTLPLHHVHGQINSIAASLSAGSTVRMLPNFDSSKVWTHLLGMTKNKDVNITVFMGVPTMYSKLIEEFDKLFSQNIRQKEYVKNYLKSNVRLMVSGSAPLPIPVFDKWNEISGHRLLERYGMTEIGMALSNCYQPMSDRTPGFVGTTLPGVSAQITKIDSIKGTVTPLVTLESSLPSLDVGLNKYYSQMKIQTQGKNLFKETGYSNMMIKPNVTYNVKPTIKPIAGELLVRGSCVFKKYWNRPEQTKSEFTSDGWFKTGDTAQFENGKVRILGRTSVDIIKSGGYKISALDIETALLGHEAIADVAVLGVPDITWGEKIAAVVEFKEKTSVSLGELQEWASQYLPKYQLPTQLFTVPKMTRNAMGKVNKKDLLKSLKIHI